MTFPIAQPPDLPVSYPRTRRSENLEIIQKIALQTLKELAVTVGAGLIICLFTATPMGILLVGVSAGIQCAVSLFFKIRTAASDKKMESQANFATASCFAIGTSTNISMLIHETGHALAATAIYRNACPRVEILPFTRGITRFNTGELSRLGQKMGAKRAIGFVTAAGPLFSLSVSLIALAASFFLDKSHPKTAFFLQISAISDFATHFFYALSALWTPPTLLSHDFIRLSLLGIHPLAAATFIIAVPIFLSIGILARKSNKSPFN